MSVIDDYLQQVEPDKRKELERVRQIGRSMVPDAEEALAYGMPALKIKEKAFLGFDAHATHIGIYPMSGSIVDQMKEALAGYETAKGSVKVPLDKPIPEELLKEIIKNRLAEINK